MKHPKAPGKGKWVMLCGGIESAWNYVAILDIGLFQVLEQSYPKQCYLRTSRFGFFHL